jgi:predicted RNA-binding protein with PIN domain
MPAHLLIDGYNFLKRSSFAAFAGADIDGARRYLLERLAEYKKNRQVKIVVVFDAPNSFSLSRQKEGFRGVEVIYSAQGETADDVMIEIIRRRHGGLVIVTSDRAIIDEAKKHGITFITPDRLEEALEGPTADEDEVRSEKKGNPRKAPKSVRRARRTIKKI